MAIVFSLAAWAHLTGRFVLRFKRTSGSPGSPRPDWLVLLIAAVAVGSLLWLILQTARRRSRTQAWMRNIAPAADHLPEGGVAGVCAERLAMDVEGVGRTRFERLKRFEIDCGQSLPNIWIDADAGGLLLGSPARGLLRYHLHSRRREWLRIAIPVALFLCLFLGIIAGAQPPAVQSLRGVPLALVGVSAATAIILCALWLFAPRGQLVFLPGRTLLVQGRRERQVDFTETFLIAVRRRERTRRGHNPLDSVRWWILSRGLPPLYVDDLAIADTPWHEQITDAIQHSPHPDLSAPGMCPGCGYSTIGLRTTRCPECGGPIDPVTPAPGTPPGSGTPSLRSSLRK